MEETSRCKTCRCSLDGENQKLVGAWTFCEACFDNLLNAEPKPQPEVESSAPELSFSPPNISMEPASEPSTYECCICEKKFSGTAFKKISSASVCESCYSGLIPAMERKPIPSRKPFVAPVPKGTNTMSQKDVELRVDMSAAPMQPKLNCVVCSKQLPAIGAAKVEDGKLFCPDCFHVRPSSSPVEETTEFPLPTESGAALAARETLPVGAPTVVCDCCERGVTSGHFAHYEGLIVCNACENYDLKSAILIARSRHASLFEAQRNERLK